MSRPWLSEQIQAEVRQRAKGLCEYCHASEQWQYVQFTIDHIMPVVAGGSNDIDNLALACFHCNRRKGRSQAALDSESGETVQLFNPRCDRWRKHFRWSEDCLRLIGTTPIGRATIEALALNRERILGIRAADYAVGRHPPSEDISPIHPN
ncbi:HNH endonuclease [Laspinema olomoucense]|uniref:HNH endonuclease n=1 Tax=Laspinema olomoucense D3b TaxID=2953688 RepID=A0ABT2N5J8_9CYAN|nr:MULTISPECIES: HNH endonuclease [unclassified Laspinema]MCT7972801.1 HNH endonuclease [Laspinema sp. D3d]MCT7976640.1 HNH endonuclease [Laspinema sp. D3b]